MSDKLVTIATFESMVEASSAMRELEAEGVKGVLVDTAAVEVAWYLTAAIGGIKLQVMEEEAARAASILDASRQEPVGESMGRRAGEIEVDGRPEPEDPCDDLSESETDELADRALRAARLGMVFLPLQAYSIWLLLCITFKGERLNPVNRRRFRQALILNTLFIVVLAIMFASVASILLSF